MSSSQKFSGFVYPDDIPTRKMGLSILDSLNAVSSQLDNGTIDAKFKSLSVSGNATISGNLTVGSLTIPSALTLSSLTVTGATSTGTLSVSGFSLAVSSASSINQDVTTTGKPTFGSVKLNSANSVWDTTTFASILNNGTVVIPAGVWWIPGITSGGSNISAAIQVRDNAGSWRTPLWAAGQPISGGFVISDGVNFRLVNQSGTTNSYAARKFV